VHHTLELDLVNVEAIRAAKLHVVVDCINSTGAISVPVLLDELGVTYNLLFDDVSGRFAHKAEPLPENLGVLAKAVATTNADLGIAVDPDVDRLVLVSEDGRMFGEEYTLVAVADYVLRHTPGPVVSNLSSSRALRDIAARYNQPYAAGAVGEVNVVVKMREVDAVLGGEGNGGIIYPALHYGRDSIVGIALFLSHLATSGKKASELRADYPDYTIVKDSLPLPDPAVKGKVLDYLAKAYADQEVDLTDGVKVDFAEGWVHLRASNTEPIVRIIAESKDEAAAKELAKRAKAVMEQALAS
jgi:phosphomannomutase